MDQKTRNTLRNVVTRCRKLLEESTAEVLQGRFGIYPGRKNGEVHIEDDSRMEHLSGEDLECRKDLLDHFEHIKAIGYKPSDALEQLIREIAFTHLNRLCAYKMMESRGLIREAVSRGLKSQGFMFYLSEHPEDEKLYISGKQDEAYRNYLDWLGMSFSQEISILFNPNDPANRIYPPQRVLDDVLSFINDEELREIWFQDETIGWIYQYFTPKELRDKARKESQAPRNSYELAFRNQFFTPRYIVEFLTDNTLGRIWYEMRKGDTILNDYCQYLVRRHTEIFLEYGEEPPESAETSSEDLSQDELIKQPVYIRHRPKKDPREIKLLDPAGGSGHFVLYGFDLFQVIYEEAYHDPDLGDALKKDFPTIEDLRRAVPGLILRHNIHTIDIDLRATQITALALWLRCQRAYQEIGLKNGERPAITRSNIVCAEPMPGENDLLKEFTSTLQPKVLGQLVETIFEKMKLASEAGSLLKIEEEIRDVVGIAREKYQEELLKRKDEEGFLPGFAPQRERTLFDFTDMTDSDFLDRAEEEIIAAMRKYAENVSNGKVFRKQLFVEDTAQGFSFIDICRKKFDIVLMNPPFGEATANIINYLSRNYSTWNKNILCAFLERGYQILSHRGFLGAVYDRTVIVKSTYEDFRRFVFIKDNRLVTMGDLGWEVLDANVEVATSAFIKDPGTEHCVFIDVRKINPEQKGSVLLRSLKKLQTGENKDRVAMMLGSNFQRFPNAVIGYDFPEFLRRAFEEGLSLNSSGSLAFTGHQFRTEQHFRSWWEISSKNPPHFLARLFNGAGFCPFWAPLRDVLISHKHINLLPNNSSTNLRNKEQHLKPGICFGKRGEYFCAHVLPSDHYFSLEGLAIPVTNKDIALEMLGVLNTPLTRFSLNKFCGQHKTSGYVNLFPYRRISDPERVRSKVEATIRAIMEAQIYDETISFFSGIYWMGNINQFAITIKNLIQRALNQVEECENLCHNLILDSYDVNDHEREQLDIFRKSQPRFDSPIGDVNNESDCEWFAAHCTISYLIGCILGRWNILYSIGKREMPDLPAPFDALPINPPGLLIEEDEFTKKSRDILSDYPVDIIVDGVIVDDSKHRNDIVQRIRKIIELIWGDHGESIEHEVCEILGIRELRDYLRKPGNGGFWMDHIKRYSKSRRKAPIYWYLRSNKGNYGLWIYYHRIDKDVFFKALHHYVEPKIRLEEDRLKSLRSRKETVGSSGKEAKQLEKDLDRQEQFVSELHDFADKLRKVANLNLQPDLNDGVVLNIAPLWELVPWKEAQKYWEELLEGKYEWSSIGKQLREKGLVD